MEGHWHGHGNGHELVGFRFLPTEEEIITYFLERKMRGLDFPVRAVEDVFDICMYEPWDLPRKHAERSQIPKEDGAWYFFNMLVSTRKGINRLTKSGFWKKTGADRIIKDKQGKQIGLRKILVFHSGRVPKGIKTDWVIHEYHSHPAASFPNEYVFSHLIRKSGKKNDTCKEQSPPSASDSGNHAAESTSTQINHNLIQEWLFDDDMLDLDPLEELMFEQGISNSNGFDHNTPSSSMVQMEEGTSNPNGFDHNTLPSWHSMVQPEQETSNSNGFDENDLSLFLSMDQQEQGTVYSDGFINELSLNDSFLETSDQEDAFVFVDSLWADEGRCSGEINVNTRLHDFNPTKPLSGVYVGDSSDRNTEMPYEQGPVLETLPLFYMNASSRGRAEMESSPLESSYCSDNDAIKELDSLSVNSDTEPVGIFHVDVVDEFPTNTRTCKAQHTPKSHKYFKAQCSKELQMQSKVSHKAVSNVEMGEKFIVKSGKDKQVAQTSSAKSSSSSCSNRSGSSNTKEFPIFKISAGYCSEGVGSNNRKGSFISLETPQLSHKTYPPVVYLFNVLVSLVLIIFTIREMVYLH